ncbi:hypothetical protein BB8028_0003g12840 [Beauveria bassiana]|uniref:Uncharacterized protein n=1 Tax=Beauveria bassiana TaxID=176275 RepID=A0A2S7Y9H8_BEABA|nr:hypothetical protein BB8028_0003g12840 [Beauveria bassiana]
MGFPPQIAGVTAPLTWGESCASWVIFCVGGWGRALIGPTNSLGSGVVEEHSHILVGGGRVWRGDGMKRNFVW